MNWSSMFEVVSEGKGYSIQPGPVLEVLIGLLVVLAIVAYYRRHNLELDKVKVTLPFIGVDTEWAPDHTERVAAWKIYIELITRISREPLPNDEGLVRESLSSLYSLFQAMRLIMRDDGPGVGLREKTVGYIALRVMNDHLRPLLATWHPRLEEWEAKIPKECGKQAHEKQWAEEPALRAALEALRQKLAAFTQELQKIADVKR